MPERLQLTKARLIEIELPNGEGGSRELAEPFDVQFNPESLKVTYSNTVQSDDQSGGSAMQFVSKSSTKMSSELWFDASAQEGGTDVRALTKAVNHFVTPVVVGDKLRPPAVRFTWGAFLFEGVMEGLDETWDLFSADGHPLRAKLSITITSQSIQFYSPDSAGPSGPAPGSRPQSQARQGDSLQQMMGRETGSGRRAEDWRAVAAANGIENPRRLAPGAFIDLARRAAPGSPIPGGRR